VGWCWRKVDIEEGSRRRCTLRNNKLSHRLAHIFDLFEHQVVLPTDVPEFCSKFRNLLALRIVSTFCCSMNRTN
jgi:hypothetical protein